jgi:hypothetical protein
MWLKCHAALQGYVFVTGPDLGLVPAGPGAVRAKRTHRNPPPGNRQEKNNALGFCLRKALFANLAGAVAIVAPLCLPAPAQAVSKRPAQGITHDVAGYFGIGPDQANNPTDPQQVIERPRVEVAPSEIASGHVVEIDARPPHLPVIAALTPSVEMPLRRLFCVEYARMRSGLAVFGDAKHWWARAKNLYARLPHPVEEAVMVFSGSKRLKRGHVAVVTEIVSPRQIIVDQANWQNKGEIDHATPVLDVSKANDWSQVRVWDIPSGTFGSRVYRISGFIAKGLQTASRE